MRRKLEDKLLMLSFGDLTPEEARQVQSEAAGDPEAQKILQEYQAIRSNLKLLKDVPEDQISAERLRFAILEKGLERKSAPSPYGWLWMPAAVALFAFSLALLRQRQPALQ